MDVRTPATEVTGENGFTGLRNFKMPIPGSTVTAYLGVFENKSQDDQYTWSYSLWINDDDDYRVAIVSSGWLELPTYVRPDQVARIAFLLDVEYGTEGRAHGL